jgi:hypothetical protein
MTISLMQRQQLYSIETVMPKIDILRVGEHIVQEHTKGNRRPSA